jgi:3-methyl-2-oxobutanoate hydroxymethyltransferase
MNVNQIREMKQRGEKSVALVVWDAPTANIAHLCGSDFLIVGDSVGVNLWGQSNNLEITLDDFLVAVKAVRRGAPDALVCADIPYGPVQIDAKEGVRAAVRLVQEGGADLVKIDAAPDFPDAVAAVTRAGIPVFAQMGLSPQSGSKYGISIGDLQQPESLVPDEMMGQLIEEARICEQAGAAMIDLTNAGPVIGKAITDAVSIPVIGGMGGGPWLDGRIRMFHAAVGYGAKFLDNPPTAYAYVAQTCRDAVAELISDVRSGQQIKGGIGRK